MLILEQICVYYLLQQDDDFQRGQEDNDLKRSSEKYSTPKIIMETLGGCNTSISVNYGILVKTQDKESGSKFKVSHVIRKKKLNLLKTEHKLQFNKSI
jgi:hypothetical protein